jgi:NodT family efflux transporter outer membrane factor (OMF) lipoprotein
MTNIQVLPRVARSSQPWTKSFHPIRIEQKGTKETKEEFFFVAFVCFCSKSVWLRLCRSGKSVVQFRRLPPAAPGSFAARILSDLRDSSMLQSLRRAAVAAWAGLALLGGCSFAPHYNAPAVQTPAAFKEAVGWKVAQPNDDMIRGNWWEMFQDPQLSALEEQVTISNQTLAAALANFQAARAVVKEARSQYFPAVSAAPSVTKSKASQSSSPVGIRSQTQYSLPLDASWEPDLWGAIRNSVKADTFNAQASAATLENLRLTAQADLAVDYYALRGQDALQEVLDATVAADQKSLDLTKALFEQGMDSDEDVSQAETALATVKAQDTNIGIQRALYEHAIALLAGRPASTFSIPVLPPATNAPVPPPEIPLAVPSQLLERRPDVAAAERGVAAANAQIGVAKAAFFPALTLSAQGGYQSSSLGNLVSGPSFFWSLGAAMAQSVFDAGLRRAAVEQYRATYDATVANYRQTVLTAFQEVEDSLSSLRVLSQERGEQEAAVQSAARTLAIATHRYELGIDSYLNVIVAQMTLLNNQQTEVNLHVQQMTSSVQLILALGGGWDSSRLLRPGQVTSQKVP